MSLLKKYIKSAGYLSARSIVERLLGMISTVMLARMLGAGPLGIYNAVMNTANSAYGIVRLGIDAALHVLTAEATTSEDDARRKESVWGASLILLSLCGLAGSAGCYFFKDWLANIFFKEPELAKWLQVASILVFLQCLSQFCYTILMGLHQFAAYAIVSSIVTVGNLVLLSAGLVFYRLPGALAAALITQILSLFLIVLILRRSLQKIRLKITFRQFTSSVLKIFRFGVPFYAAGLLAIPATYYLQGLLSRNWGIETLGYLRIVISFSSLIHFLPTGVAAVSLSTLTRIYSDPKYSSQQFMEYTLLNIKVTAFFCLTLAMILVMLLPILIPFLFGGAYLEALPAARIGVFTSVFAAIWNCASHSYFAQKKPIVIFLQSVVQVLALLLLSWFLIPRFGLVGYVLTDYGGYTAICLSVIGVATYQAKDLNLNTRSLWGLFGLNVGALSTLWVLDSLELLEPIKIYIATGIFLSLFLVGYYSLFTSSEKARFATILSDILKRFSPPNVCN